MHRISKGFTLILVVILAVSSLMLVKPASAQTPIPNPPSPPVVTINADGSIDPPTAPISRNGNVYTMTGDFDGYITIAASNIVLNGARHTVMGIEGEKIVNTDTPNIEHITEIYNVTNLTIANFVIIGSFDLVRFGINLYGASNSIIANNSISNQYIAIWMGGAVGIIVSGNNITNCQTKGIFVGDYSDVIQNRVTNTGSTNLPGGGYSGGVAILLSSNCAIAGNLIEDNAIGIAATTSGGLFNMVPGGPQGSIIYDNNFINNTNNVVNSAVMGASIGTIAIWNNGKIGNYWSDYFAKYPNAVEILNSGIGNTPYTIDSNNTDYYPLLAPYDISSNALKLINLLPSPTPTASPSHSPIITVSPSPTVSEFSWLAILPLTLSILSIAVIVRHRKQASLSK